MNALSNVHDIAPSIEDAKSVNMIENFYLRIRIAGICCDVKFVFEFYDRFRHGNQNFTNDLQSSNNFGIASDVHQRAANFFERSRSELESGRMDFPPSLFKRCRL